MTNSEILQSDLLDILFENRNKQYGAYTLRRSYNNHMIISLACTLSIVFLLLMVNSFSVKNGEQLIVHDNKDPVKLTAYTADLEKPESGAVNQVKNVPVLIVPATQINETEMPTQEELDNALISNKNATGENPLSSERSTDTIDRKENPIEQQEHRVGFTPIELQASYPGGPQAFSDFLSRNLIPPAELESGEIRKVVARFFVDVDGSISKIEIIESAGKNFDKEVIRVLRKMPKWNPAEQNGHKVATAFSQPVSFVGNEQ